MCLGIPMVVSSIEKNYTAIAETMGVKRTISMRLLPEAQPGDHVLVHAGFAMEIIEPAEAGEKIKLLKSMLKEST